jgi:hypothetical protein
MPGEVKTRHLQVNMPKATKKKKEKATDFSVGILLG